jgi:uncharacterized membrane protein YczE
MRKKYLSREYLTRVCMCLVGVAIIGSGAGALRYGNFGLDPCMSLVNGLFMTILDSLGISFGTSFLLLCFVFLLAVIFFDRSKIGISTLINMVLTGYASDFFLFLLNKISVPESASFFFRLFIMLSGVVVISFGAGIYLNTNIGASPYDAVGLIIAEKLKKPYRWIRIGTDIICTVLGFLMGSMPGIGTLIMALLTGPLITFFRIRVLVCGKRLGIIRWT